MEIHITNAARARIEEICASQERMVRLLITSGGCQGFNKVWDLADAVNPDDREFLCGSGRMLIDETSLELLSGATIDYQQDLKGSYFSVSIPTAISTCGCGTSFSI